MRRRLASLSSLAVRGLLVVSFTGCAAIFKGSNQTVQFESDPAGAKVESNGRYLGDTPASASVSRLGSMNIRVSKPGFAESSGVMERRPDTPWLVFDLVTCVIPVLLCIPVLVDALSGAWMDVDDVYRVKLDRLPAAAPAPSAGAAPQSL
jgi:hypothetical protein